MQIYARIAAGGVVAELWPHAADAPMPDPQPTPVEVFGEALGSTFVPCDATVRQGWTYDGHSFSAPPPPPPPTAEDLVAYAANARWIKETGGITVAGIPVATDDSSQGKITGAQAMVTLNPSFTTAWKGSNGSFTTLTATEITAIATAVGNHVAACFAAEEQVDAAITAGTITTTAQIDAAFAAVTA